MSTLVISTAAILLVVLPTVAYGGVSILRLVYIKRSDYMQNDLRRRFWRAGHAHAGVFLILSLVALLYLDAAQLSTGLKSLITWLIPGAAILVPAAFFFSVAAPDAEKPNALINLAYLGFASLTVGLVLLGAGLFLAL
ncbi:hypothetical protein BH24DEI2_BH24DEI2_04390 [soil metagenome]